MVTFDAKGGEVYPLNKSVVWKSNYGDLPIPTKNNRSFDAWYTSATFEDVSRISKDTVVAQVNDHTAYTRYKYPVYFVAADGTEKAIEVYDDINHMDDPGKAPDFQNYIFDYWARKNGEEYEEFDFSKDRVVPGMRLLAVYHRYVSTINNNEWIVNGKGSLHFHFVRNEFKDGEKPSAKDLCQDFENNDRQIYVDDNLLGENQYDYKNGSLIVSLKDSYLNDLSLGTHNLRIKFTDGTVSTSFIVKERARPSTDQYVFPKTGLE